MNEFNYILIKFKIGPIQKISLHFFMCVSCVLQLWFICSEFGISLCARIRTNLILLLLRTGNEKLDEKTMRNYNKNQNGCHFESPCKMIPRIEHKHWLLFPKKIGIISMISGTAFIYNIKWPMNHLIFALNMKLRKVQANKIVNSRKSDMCPVCVWIYICVG